MRPISASGWRTVVSAGSRSRPARCRRSRRSRGPRGSRRPRSRAARIAPIAVLSLKAKIAVGGSGASSSCPAASMPPSMSKLDSSTSAGSGRTPAAASAPWKPFRRSLLARQACGPVIAPIRRWPSESRCSVASCARGVRGRDGRDALVERHARIDDHERVALAPQDLELVVRLLRQHQHRAVGRPVHEPVEQRRPRARDGAAWGRAPCACPARRAPRRRPRGSTRSRRPRRSAASRRRGPCGRPRARARCGWR